MPRFLCRSVLPPGSMPLTFRVDGIEPKDDAWAQATPEEKRLFWRNAGVIAMEVKQRELTAGLDYAGRKLRAVQPRRLRYKSGRPLDGEPLMPHRAMSRTRMLLRYMVQATGIVFYWANGWAKILDYHRRGAVLKRHGRCVGRLPVRNVFGISPKGKQEIARRAAAAWRAGQTVKPSSIHPLMPPGGVSVSVPFDPAAKRPTTVEDFLSLGIKVTKSRATHREVNTATGIKGAKTPDVRLKLDWTGWRA